MQKTERINDATFSGSEENKQTTLKVKTTRRTNRYKIRHETKYKHIESNMQDNYKSVKVYL